MSRVKRRERNDDVLLIKLTSEEWEKVVDKQIRGHILVLVEQSKGDPEVLRQFLVEQGVISSNRRLP